MGMKLAPEERGLKDPGSGSADEAGEAVAVESADEAVAAVREMRAVGVMVAVRDEDGEKISAVSLSAQRVSDMEGLLRSVVSGMLVRCQYGTVTVEKTQ